MEYKRITQIEKPRLLELFDKYEGYSKQDITIHEMLELFSYLITSGDINYLQGFYQRECENLILCKYLSREGYILYK